MTQHDVPNAMDTDLLRRVESGRYLIGGTLAASFAAALTIRGASLEGDLIKYAMISLVTSMPPLCIYLFVTSHGHQRNYHVSKLMQWMPVLGLLAALIGFCFLFESAVPGTGLLLGVLTVGCGIVCVQSNDRAKAKQTLKNAG